MTSSFARTKSDLGCAESPQIVIMCYKAIFLVFLQLLEICASKVDLKLIICKIYVFYTIL